MLLRPAIRSLKLLIASFIAECKLCDPYESLVYTWDFLYALRLDLVPRFVYSWILGPKTGLSYFVLLALSFFKVFNSCCVSTFPGNGIIHKHPTLTAFLGISSCSLLGSFDRLNVHLPNSPLLIAFGLDIWYLTTHQFDLMVQLTLHPSHHFVY